MSRTIHSSTQFKKDLKRAKKEGKDISEVKKVISLLENEEELPEKYKDHPLTGILTGSRECHVLDDDDLFIYKIDLSTNEVKLARYGSHSNLFGSQKKTKQSLK